MNRAFAVVSCIAALMIATAARADVYTWVDPAGNVTVSNVAPPDGARVTNVTRTSAADKEASERARDSARDAEVRTLSDRVRDLEQQVQAATSAPLPDIMYPAVAGPPLRYGMGAPPPAISYAPQEPPLDYAPADCPPGWISCWGWWNVPGVVVIDGAGGHHRRGGHRNGTMNGGGRRTTLPQHATPAASRAIARMR